MPRYCFTLLCALISGFPFVSTAEAGSRADARPVAAVSEKPSWKELHPDLIQKTIQRYLQGEWGARIKAVQVTVLEPSDPMRIPAGVIELQVAPSPDEGLGRRPFHLTITSNGKLWKT